MPTYSPRQLPDPLTSSDSESSLNDTPTPCVVVRSYLQPTTPQNSVGNGRLGERAFQRRPNHSRRHGGRVSRTHHGHPHNAQPITPIRRLRDSPSILVRTRPESHRQNKKSRTRLPKRKGAQAPLLLDTDPEDTPINAQNSGKYSISSNNCDTGSVLILLPQITLHPGWPTHRVPVYAQHQTL
jgi:hypothetical protein